MQPGELQLRVGILNSQALRDRCVTGSKTQRQVLKRGTEMTIVLQVPRDRGERWISVQALGNWCTELWLNLQRYSWTATIFKSLIIDILRKSSRMFEGSDKLRFQDCVKLEQRPLLQSRHSRARRRWDDCSRIDKSCRNSTLMEETQREALVGSSCGKLLWEALVGSSCGKLLWEALVPWTPSYTRDSSQVKDTKEGRETAFFTPLDPFGDEAEEEYDDLSKPRKVHYKNKWKVSQVAVYWVNVGKAHDKGLQFWQKRSHAIIFMIQYQLTALKKSGKPQRRQKFSIKGFLRHDQLRKSCWQSIGNWSMANFQAARNLVRGGRLFQHCSLCSRSSTKNSAWRSRKSDQDSSLGEYAQNAILNRICHCWLE